MIFFYSLTLGLIIFEIVVKTLINHFNQSSLVIINNVFEFGLFELNLGFKSGNFYEMLIFIAVVLSLTGLGLLSTIINENKLYSMALAFIISFIFSLALDLLFNDSLINYIKIFDFSFTVSNILGVVGIVLLVVFVIKNDKYEKN